MSLPNTDFIGTLEITAVSGSDIKAKTLVSKPNLYVVFEIGNKKQKTSEKQGKNPKWNEVFTFDVCEDSVLRANVYNSKSNEFVGGLELVLKETICIEKHNLKMKITNEKQQDKGELHLLLNFKKKATPLPFIPNPSSTSISSVPISASTQPSDIYARTEKDIVEERSKENERGGSSSTYIPVYQQESFAGQSQNNSSKHVSLNPSNYGSALPHNNKLPSKIKMYGGGAHPVHSQGRARAFSPLAYDPSHPLARSSSREHLYHFKSDESLNVKKSSSPVLPTPDVDSLPNVFSQPSYGGYLNSQSEDEMDVYSSSLPTHPNTLLSSSPGQFNHYLYNNGSNSNGKKSYAHSLSPSSSPITSPAAITPTSKFNKISASSKSPLKTEFNTKYSNTAVQSPLKSDNASVYSSHSGGSGSYAHHPSSPSLVIKTSSNSMKKNVNTIHSASSATPTPTPSSASATSSTLTTPSRGTSFLPKPISSTKNGLKSYVPMERQGSVGANYRMGSGSVSSSIKSGTGSDRETSDPSSSESQPLHDGHLRGNRPVFSTVGKSGHEHSKSGPAYLYGPRHAPTKLVASEKLDRVRGEEEKSRKTPIENEDIWMPVNDHSNRRAYKVRSISNDSRLYKGHLSLTSNNTIISYEDYSGSDLHPRHSRETDTSSQLYSKSSSISTDVLVIDDNSDQRSSRGSHGSRENSSVLGKLLAANGQRNSQLRRSASWDSFVGSADRDSQEWYGPSLSRKEDSHQFDERGRSSRTGAEPTDHRRYYSNEDPSSEEFHRPQKSKERMKDTGYGRISPNDNDNPPRSLSLLDSKRKTLQNQETQTLTSTTPPPLPLSPPVPYARNLSLTRHISLKSKHNRSVSQPLSGVKKRSDPELDRTLEENVANVRRVASQKEGVIYSKKVQDLNNLTHECRAIMGQPSESFGVTKEEEKDETRGSLPRKYSPRRTSLSSKNRPAQMLLHQDRKPIKVISPSTTPIPAQARIANVREGPRSAVALVAQVDDIQDLSSPTQNRSETPLHRADSANSASKGSYSKASNASPPQEIDFLQQELNKISISLKKKKQQSPSQPLSHQSSLSSKSSKTLENGSIKSQKSFESMGSTGSIGSIGSSRTNPHRLEDPIEPSSTHSSPRVKFSSQGSSRMDSPKSYTSALSATSMSSHGSKHGPSTITPSTTPLMVEPLKSQDTSEDDSIIPSSSFTSNTSDKKDKILWKDKYLKYIRKNSIQGRSKLDQCISEANSDTDGGSTATSELVFSDSLKSIEPPRVPDYSIKKEESGLETPSSSTATFEEVRVIEESGSNISGTNSAHGSFEPSYSPSPLRRLDHSPPNIRITNEEVVGLESGEEEASLFHPSQETYPHFANVSISTIHQDEDLQSEREGSILQTPNFLNAETSYEIMNSREDEGNKDGEGLNYMNSQELLTRTNLSSISYAGTTSSPDLLSPSMVTPAAPLSSPSPTAFHRNSVERKKILENNFNLLSQQIQKIRNEVANTQGARNGLETDKSDTASFIDPPRFDSNVDVNEAIEDYNLSQSINASSSSSRLFYPSSSEAETHPSTTIPTSTSTTTPTTVSRQRDDSLFTTKNLSSRNIVVKPVLKSSHGIHSTPSSNEATTTPTTLRHPDSREALEVCSNTSTISTSSTLHRRDPLEGEELSMEPTIESDRKEETIDLTVYPQDETLEEVENQGTITRTTIQKASVENTLEGNNIIKGKEGDNKKEKDQEGEDDDEEEEEIETPTLHQATYQPFNSSLRVPRGSAIQAEIYNISFDESDEEEEEQPPRTLSLRYNREELLGQGPGSGQGHGLRMRSNSLSSILSTTHSNWTEEEEADRRSLLSVSTITSSTGRKGSDPRESMLSTATNDFNARRLTFGMDTNEQLFHRLKRSNSLSSISTTSSYTYTLITKDSDKNQGQGKGQGPRNKLSSLLPTAYAPQRIPPVRPMVNLSHAGHQVPPVGGLVRPNYGLGPGSMNNNNNFNGVKGSQGPTPYFPAGYSRPTLKPKTSGDLILPYPPDLDHPVSNSNYLSPYDALSRNGSLTGSILSNRTSSGNSINGPNGVNGANGANAYRRPNSPLSATGEHPPILPISSTTSTAPSTAPSLTKPQKSHKRFGHFKKGSISNLPMNTYHPLTHHGYKGDEGFLTEEAANANLQIKNALEENNGTLTGSTSSSSSKPNKSKPSRIPFLNHKRNNSSVSHDSSGTNSTVNLLSSTKLEMHPITNQL